MPVWTAGPNLLHKDRERDQVYVIVTLIVLGVLLTASWAEEGDLLGIEQRKLRIFSPEHGARPGRLTAWY